MKLEIILTPKAKDSLLAIVLFIQLKWGDRSAENFLKKLTKH
jgi:plasmid stabilization system protein ParE